MVLAMVFAPSCAGCDAPGADLCADCRQQLEPAPWVPPPPGVDAIGSLFAYDGVGRRVVLGLKYHNRRGEVAVLADGLAEVAAGLLLSVGADHGRPVVTWAPTTSARRRRRGFDQARRLAVALGPRLGLPVCRLLGRGPSPPQTGSGRAQRWERPVFVGAGAAAPPSVVLVDDVCTSGATLAAAAHALRNCGTENVVAVTLAQTSLNRARQPVERNLKPAGHRPDQLADGSAPRGV
jgi:predicted amidophosphoribosyltransferase